MPKQGHHCEPIRQRAHGRRLAEGTQETEDRMDRLQHPEDDHACENSGKRPGRQAAHSLEAASRLLGKVSHR